MLPKGTMRVVRLEHKEDPEGDFPYQLSLQYVPNVRPAIPAGKTYAVVRVLAAALNHRDNWITKGMYPGIQTGVTLGSDACGVVERLVGTLDFPARLEPKWVGKLVVVDPTLGWPRGSEAAPPGKLSILGMPHNGTFADYVYVPVANLREKPPHLTTTEAAAVPLAGVTAYRALVTKGNVGAGSRVLITGVGGGVAILSVQIAVALKAEVWITTSWGAKIQRACILGAKGGVNYTDERWDEDLREKLNGKKFDVVVDGAGGENVAKLIRLIKPGGRLVSYGGTADSRSEINLPHLFLHNIDLKGTSMGSPEDFDRLIELMNKHKVIPIVDSIYPLKGYEEAMERMRAGNLFGKIVLDLAVRRAKL